MDYASLHAGVDSSTHDGNKWLHVIGTKDIKKDNFRRMQGSDITSEWLENDPDALKEPIIIESPEGLGMRMPSKEFTVADVAECVGSETPLEVIGKLLELFVKPFFRVLFFRCLHTIYCSGMDTRQMGRILFSACNFSR